MAAGDAILSHVVTFGRVLREAGIEVGPGRVADALRALDSVDLARQDDLAGMTAADGFHPSTEGHREVARTFARALLRAGE